MNYVSYHSHSPMMFWIGKGAEKGKDWVESWWNPFIKKIESSLRVGEIAALSDASALAYSDSGISEVWDMYFHEERIAKRLSSYGIKVHAGEVIMNNSPLGISAEESLEKSENLIRKFRNNPLVIPTVAFIGPYKWASDKKIMEKSARLAAEFGVPVHTHGAGTFEDYNGCLREYKTPPIKVLEDFGFFSRQIHEVVIAHCAVMDETELSILEKYKNKVKIAICPRASEKLNYPSAPLREFLMRGIPAVLGTDGASPSGLPDIDKEITIASETYRIPKEYFSEKNKSTHISDKILPEERKRIIQNWKNCLESLVNRTGLTGGIRKEFLNQKI